MGHFAVNRSVSVLMLTLVLILFGGAAYLRLPRDLFPEVSQPGLVIRTPFEGATSGEIEAGVTRKIEDVLGSVKDVVSMTSRSGGEVSEIALTFSWGTDMDLAAMDVRAKLDEVAADLHEDAGDPVVLGVGAGAGAVLVLNAAPNMRAPEEIRLHPDHLRGVVEQLVQPRLERINGVAAIQVAGGRMYEIQVIADPARLAAHALSLPDLRTALERENVSQRGGRLREEASQFLVRTSGSVTLESLDQLIVSRPGQPVVRLRDVATIRENGGDPAPVPRAPESHARLGSGGSSAPSVSLSVYKKSGGNSVLICQAVREARLGILADLALRHATPPVPLDEATLHALAQASSPTPTQAALLAWIETNAPLEIVLTYDESTFIEESLAMVQSNGLQGLLLASLILLVFLRRVQSTLVVCLSMPVSVIATFSLFYAAGIGINIFSMAGLTLAVGMVVDNAIVVTESIFHRLQHERRVKKAIIEAVTEIGPAVWASTLTTVAVFLPIVFVPGVAGQIFRDLSWVITFTLAFSILFAFTLIPMLTFHVMRMESRLFDLLNRLMDILTHPILGRIEAGTAAYRHLLSWFMTTLRARLALVGVMGVVFALALLWMPPLEFFPDTKTETFALTVRPHVGLSLDAVNTAAVRIESSLETISTVKRFNTRVTTDEIRILLTFDKRDVMAERVHPLRELSPLLAWIERDAVLANTVLACGVESLNPMKDLLGTTGGDILLKVSGPDLDALHGIVRGTPDAPGLIQTLRDRRTEFGLAAVGHVAGGVPEWILRVNRDAAADAGLTLACIADQVEAAVAGTKATDLLVRDSTYDIVLTTGAPLATRADLLNLDILPPPDAADRHPRKLREVVTLEETRGYLYIEREERERVLYIPLFIDKDTVALGDVVERLRAPGSPIREIEARHARDGYRIRMGGTSEALDTSMGYMVYAFLVAIVLVYMVMASQFESLIHPFTIMFSVPLSLIGAVIGLRLSGDALSLTAMIGMIMLAGIVVNNGIILVDYVNILRARGQLRNAAILDAGVTRMRPIFMTALTTILGMAPLALGLGTGAELYKPLAVVVVAGLGFSTVLTLVFIPVIYCLMDDIADVFGFLGFRLSILFGKEG